MKTNIKILSFALVSAFLLSLSVKVSAKSPDQVVLPSVSVYLTNNCSAPVKVYVKAPGSATYVTVDAAQKKQFSCEPGTKIFDESGKKLIAEITDASAGKEFIVCK